MTALDVTRLAFGVVLYLLLGLLFGLIVIRYDTEKDVETELSLVGVLIINILLWPVVAVSVYGDLPFKASVRWLGRRLRRLQR